MKIYDSVGKSNSAHKILCLMMESGESDLLIFSVCMLVQLL